MDNKIVRINQLIKAKDFNGVQKAIEQQVNTSANKEFIKNTQSVLNSFFAKAKRKELPYIDISENEIKNHIANTLTRFVEMNCRNFDSDANKTVLNQLFTWFIKDKKRFLKIHSGFDYNGNIQLIGNEKTGLGMVTAMNQFATVFSQLKKDMANATFFACTVEQIEDYKSRFGHINKFAFAETENKFDAMPQKIAVIGNPPPEFVNVRESILQIHGVKTIYISDVAIEGVGNVVQIT